MQAFIAIMCIVMSFVAAVGCSPKVEGHSVSVTVVMVSYYATIAACVWAAAWVAVQ